MPYPDPDFLAHQAMVERETYGPTPDIPLSVFQQYYRERQAERREEFEYANFLRFRAVWRAPIASLLEKIHHLKRCNLRTCEHVNFRPSTFLDQNTVSLSPLS